MRFLFVFICIPYVFQEIINYTVLQNWLCLFEETNKRKIAITHNDLAIYSFTCVLSLKRNNKMIPSEIIFHTRIAEYIHNISLYQIICVISENYISITKRTFYEIVPIGIQILHLLITQYLLLLLFSDHMLTTRRQRR